MTNRKATLIRKDPPKKNRPQQPATRNVPTDDTENTNCTNQEGNLRFVN